MADQGKPAGLRGQGPRHGGERARPGDGATAHSGPPEETAGERLGVAVEDHGGGFEALAVLEPHAGHARAAGDDLDHGSAGAEARARPLGEPGERLGEAVHAALHEVDALALDVRDHVERGRGEEGGGAAVGRVAPEELAQAGVAEEVAERLPQGAVAVDGSERAEAELPAGGEGRAQAGPLRTQEGGLDGVVNAPDVGAEAQVTARLRGAGERGHGVGRAPRVGEEVEHAAVGEGVARQAIDGRDPHVVVEALAEGREDLLEDPAHGEHGRPRVERAAAGDHLPHLAAHAGRPLQHGHVEPAVGEEGRGDQAAHARADDHDPTAAEQHAGGVVACASGTVNGPSPGMAPAAAGR